jgi:hypothetical protein
MLLVITIRPDGQRYADGHIGAEGFDRVFCGTPIPTAVIECGLSAPNNPYVGKAPATCPGCISEFNNGRREGWRGEEP